MNNPGPLRVVVSNCDIAKRYAYIYAIYSNEYNCIYIGQTRSAYGALGRLSQHLSDNSGNTFQVNLRRRYRLESISLGFIEFGAVPLTDRKEFINESADYREAVEYLVQWEILNRIRKSKQGLGIISRVESISSYRVLDFVRVEANVVSEILWNWVSEIKK